MEHPAPKQNKGYQEVFLKSILIQKIIAMKKLVKNIFSTISQNEMKNLTEEVKETMAFEFAPAKEKVFTAADLWSIHRQTRTRISRRFN